MDAPGKPGAGRHCPICRKPPDPSFRPFCSKRCADIDLSRWLKGVYVIPGEDKDREQDPARDEPDPGSKS